MPRITPVQPETATGIVREQLDGIRSQLGVVPNLMATFAQSPAVLQFFLAGSKALAGARLSAKVREQIDLLTSQLNGCDYCLAAHTLLAKGHKLTDDQILAARQGRSTDPHTAAVLSFAESVVLHRGRVTADDFTAARAAGVTDTELAEVFAVVALKIFTNYFAIATQVDLDFPAAPELAPQSAHCTTAAESCCVHGS